MKKLSRTYSGFMDEGEDQVPLTSFLQDYQLYIVDNRRIDIQKNGQPIGYLLVDQLDAADAWTGDELTPEKLFSLVVEHLYVPSPHEESVREFLKLFFEEARYFNNAIIHWPHDQETDQYRILVRDVDSLDAAYASVSSFMSHRGSEPSLTPTEIGLDPDTWVELVRALTGDYDYIPVLVQVPAFIMDSRVRQYFDESNTLYTDSYQKWEEAGGVNFMIQSVEEMMDFLSQNYPDSSDDLDWLGALWAEIQDISDQPEP